MIDAGFMRSSTCFGNDSFDSGGDPFDAVPNGREGFISTDSFDQDLDGLDKVLGLVFEVGLCVV